MGAIFETTYGGIGLILVGLLVFCLIFIGNRSMNDANIKFFMCGVGLIILGVVVLLEHFGKHRN